jgi:hypothetical protein
VGGFKLTQIKHRRLGGKEKTVQPLPVNLLKDFLHRCFKLSEDKQPKEKIDNRNSRSVKNNSKIFAGFKINYNLSSSNELNNRYTATSPGR